MTKQDLIELDDAQLFELGEASDLTEGTPENSGEGAENSSQ